MIDKAVNNILQNRYTNEAIHKQKLLEVVFLAQQLLENINCQNAKSIF
jgi:hypothetical protein